MDAYVKVINFINLSSFQFLKRKLNIKALFIKNCDETAPNIIRVSKNSSFYMTNKCDIISNVCAEYDAFYQAKVNFKYF